MTYLPQRSNQVAAAATVLLFCILALSLTGKIQYLVFFSSVHKLNAQLNVLFFPVSVNTVFKGQIYKEAHIDQKT